MGDLSAQLHASEQRLQAVLAAALDCIVMIDHEGTILDVNRAAEETFGIRADEVRGQEMAEIIVPPALRPAHRAGLARYVGGGEPSVLDRRIEIIAQRADGTVFPVELAITRIDVPGDPVFVGYLRDISDRLETEEALRSSRKDLLQTAYEARRKLERDLHDGAQQRLVGLALTLRMARARVEGEPADLLDEAIADLAAATEELRDLARGIHPAVLTDGGLGPALRALVSRMPLEIDVTALPDRRFGPDVEQTAYFVASEALTNVIRYAGTRHASVHVQADDRTLSVEVADRGRGGASLDAGSGLRGLAARVAAHDGRLYIDSVPGEGTRIRAEIPCG